MKEKEKQINHEMVILARESRGYTQKELAKKLSVTQSALSRVESGLRGMTINSLKHLSDVLGYPVSFFNQKRPTYGIGLVEVFHRKRQSVGMKPMAKIYSLIEIRTNEIAKMLKGVDIGELDFPQYSLEDYDGSPHEIARLVRAKWRLPRGPVTNLTAVFENARGIIVPFDFETTKIDAISNWTLGLPPLFFINKYIPTDRMRFTLAHELGHMVMHQSFATPDVEIEANEFASEFLMPAKDVSPYLTDLSIEKLASLKPYWKVSMSALLKRATDLKLISARHSRTLWMQISRAGYKSREPMELDIPPEPPTLLNEIIRVYFNEMNYSVQELAKTLHLNDKEVESLYLERDDHIRLLIKEAEDIIKNGDKDK
jgi:Zn-dependent peptidase ImmA (M78 family)/transcriptional regulator with XRE-family HTH domain